MCRRLAASLGRFALGIALIGHLTDPACRGQSPAVSQPVAIWPSGPLEVIAAFDRPIDRAHTEALVNQQIQYFDKSAAQPRGALRIAGARLIDDGRTLILATDPHAQEGRYVLPAPIIGAGTYNLTGVDAAWSEKDSLTDNPTWRGWLPALDSGSLRALSTRSKPHERALAYLARPGSLVLGALLRVPAGMATLRFESNASIDEAILGETQAEAEPPSSNNKNHRVTITTAAKGEPLFLSVTLRTGESDMPLTFKGSFRGGGENGDHAIARDQLLLPWVPTSSEAAGAAPLVVPDLAGGDASRGKTLFFGDQARCSQCHAIDGQGGKIGPDLTQLGTQSRADIYRSIAAPSAQIDPLYRSYTVATSDGQVVVGVVRAIGADAIQVTDTTARSTSIPRDQIAQIRPSATSIMPIGLTGALGLENIRDLITFLTTSRTIGK